MKKLLVLLMLGAGFVTTASAEPVDCNVWPTSLCCTDRSSIENAIYQAPTHAILTPDKYSVTGLEIVLLNDGENHMGCQDIASYRIQGQSKLNQAVFLWQPGDWINTIQFYMPAAN